MHVLTYLCIHTTILMTVKYSFFKGPLHTELSPYLWLLTYYKKPLEENIEKFLRKLLKMCSKFVF